MKVTHGSDNVFEDIGFDREEAWRKVNGYFS